MQCAKLLLKTSKQSSANSANKVFSQDYLFKELANGLRILVVKTDYPDLVSVQMKFDIAVLFGDVSETFNNVKKLLKHLITLNQTLHYGVMILLSSSY